MTVFRVPLAERKTTVLAWGEHERDFRWWDSHIGVAVPVVGLSHALQNSSLDCFMTAFRVPLAERKTTVFAWGEHERGGYAPLV